jgi:hypothetical protein
MYPIGPASPVHPVHTAKCVPPPQHVSAVSLAISYKILHAFLYVILASLDSIVSARPVPITALRVLAVPLFV